MTYVVDTSVFLRWWVEQVGWQHAQRVRDEFLAGDLGLITPDFTRIELAEVLRRKGLLDGVLDLAEYLTAVQALDVVGVDLVPLDGDGLRRSATLAATRSLRMFDAIGASLALDRGHPLLTGDARSARALAGVVDVEVLQGI
ncbi:MAG: type II toxin-antitoxin system VapC family toxin [Acidimicrobiales bacterium]